MQTFTGFQYLLIDVANNHHGDLDKETYDDRIAWAMQNLARLEEEAEGKVWKERPLYLKACMAVRKAQQGIPTGHLVGFDAICSGMQIMSVVTGCEVGAEATGLINQNKRADAYTDCTNLMANIIQKPIANLRKSVKNAVMTSLYGSKAEPIKEFGDGTDELNAFYQAMYQLCPGACELLDALVNSWRAWALDHTWELPDGFVSKVKVYDERKSKIEVDELGHTTFEYVWQEHSGKERDVKNAANVVHSLDAYVLRCLIRRCNYNPAIVQEALQNVTDVLLARKLGTTTINLKATDDMMYYKELWERTQIADVVCVEHLTWANCNHLATKHLEDLRDLMQTMLAHKPFQIVTIHDDFKCHPNNMNQLRQHYNNIRADLADSTALNDILTQLYGQAAVFTKKSQNLSSYIRTANYALS